MDRFEKTALMIAGAMLMIFFFSVLYAVKQRDRNVPQCVPYDQPYSKGKLVQLDANTYQLYYLAKMWSFDPPTVEIPLGSVVDIFVTSADVVHGLHIVEKKVNMMAVGGSLNLQTVTFDKPGVYKVTCHEFCGMAHQTMQGEIIVK